MTDFPSYTLGTVSVSNGATAIVGDGTIWSGINARAGDTIVIGTSTAIIVDVTDDTHLKIDAWPFTAVTAGTSYKIIQNSPLRFVGGQAMADVSSLIAVLRANGLLWYLPDGYTDPNDIVPALTADDGQGILRISTGALWVMTGGTWVAAGTYKGFQYKGAYNPVTAFVANDVITSGGSAYIVTASTTGNAPPNASYYDVFASKGDTGTMTVGTVTTGAGGSSAAVTNSGTSTAAVFDFTIPAGKSYSATSTTSLAIGTGSKAFTTQSGLAYTNGARVRASSAANTTNWMEGLVTYSGTTLTMTSDKTNGSGTHTDWNLNVVGEPGAGDLTSANNLSDLASATTALTNLGGTAVGKAVFTATDEAAARAAIGSVVKIAPQARLTLTSGVAATQSDVSGATTIYLTPVASDMVALYDGSAWAQFTLSELSLALDSNSGHTGYHASGAVFDMFLVSNSGVLTLASGPSWTSSASSRGTGAGTTELEMYSGLPVNKNSITLRFGSASGNTLTAPARTAVYVGSFYATADGQASDTAQNRCLFSAQCQVLRPISLAAPADHTYSSSAAFQTLNNNTANCVRVLQGLVGGAVRMMAVNTVSNSTATYRSIFNGIGLNSSFVNSANSEWRSVSSAFPVSVHAEYIGIPGLGLQTFYWLEKGAGSDTQTWFQINSSFVGSANQ